MSTAAPDRNETPTGLAALDTRPEGRREPGIAILVVDDTDGNLTAVKAMLSDLDAAVVTARSGEEALRVLLRRDFALILLDVRMPGMDGFETARLVRSRERNRHTPIIFLTAYTGDRAHELHGYALGAVDFLSKPVLPEVLRGKVSALIEVHRKSDELRRQGLALQEAERRAHGRELEAERRRWREQLLVQQVERERRAAADLQHANARLRVIADVIGDLLRAADPVEAAPRVLGHAASLGAELGLWYSGEPPRLAAHVGIDDATAARLDGEPANAHVRSAMASGGPAVAYRDGDAEDGEAAGRLAHDAAAQALATFPLTAGGRVHGLLAFGTRGAPLAPEDVSALAIVADHVASALERNGLLAELSRTAAELRAANARKDEFLALLGHELRNPLVPVVSAIKLVQRHGTGKPGVDRAVSAADRQIGHMRRLLDDLLDVSRIETGKIELRRTITDLRQVIDDALRETESAVAARRHALDLKIPSVPVLVDGDPVRLAQVVANLVHNAAKYTEPGGRLQVAVDQEDGAVVLRVRDDGIGLDPAVLPRIFDLFVQAGEHATRPQGGLGIGLTLVRRLVELHGGSVVARSDGPGLGSEFEVRLPRAARSPDAPPADEPERDARSEAPARPLRIVLVEDDADNRDSLRALLEDLGHAVETVGDGPAGIALVQARRPDLALIDIGLPGMDGYSVARALRGSVAGTRLVAMTGYGTPEDRRLALDAGFDAHLVKPLELTDLHRLLAEPP